MIEGRLGHRLVDAAADRNPIHVGDVIQTRQNTRDQYTTDGHRVLNREIWRVAGLDDRGRIIGRCLTRNAHAHLDPAYVTQHAVLAYATTIAGAQGRTTDTSHVLVTPHSTSQSLYVGMTRGRQRNTAHVVFDSYDHDEFHTGEITLEAAFKAVVTRTPDGSQSASSIQRDSTTRRAPLGDDRRARRTHENAGEWWATAKHDLPETVRAALAGHDAVIVAVLDRYGPTADRAAAVRFAQRSIDWQQPRAADTFARRLRATAGSTSRPSVTHQPVGLQRDP